MGGGYGVHLWDVISGEQLQIKGHQSNVWSVSFSPRGDTFLSGGTDRILRIWDVASGELAFDIKGHDDHVNSVSISPTGEMFASVSCDGTARLWNSSNGKQLRKMNGRCVNSVCFSPDGKLLVSSSGRHMQMWQVQNGKCLAKFEGNLVSTLGISVSFSPNGKYLVTAGAGLQFWDIKSKKTFLYRYTFGPRVWLDLLPDGRFDASPESMRYFSYWNTRTLNWHAVDELVEKLHDPKAVKEVLKEYIE